MGFASVARAETRTVRPGGDLQAAVDAARPGDVILLEAGATYPGPLFLPKKSGSEFITIQSSRADELPAGVRVTPAQSHLLPKIVATGANLSAVHATEGAHHFRFVGIEFAPRDASTVLNSLLELSTPGGELANHVHHLVIDRCYIHGLPNAHLRRGVALNAGQSEVINSYISEIRHEGYDSQAIADWYGGSGLKIINNHLEAAGENVFFGGGDSIHPEWMPQDIEIRGNHFYKPLRWRAADPSYDGQWSVVKNHLEIKAGKRIVIDGNYFENNWSGQGQDGWAIVLAPTNQDGGAPWSTVQDVELTNNRIVRSGAVFNLGGSSNDNDTEPLKRVTIRNNVAEDIDGTKWGGWRGAFLMITSASDVVVDHNTSFHDQQAVITYGTATTGFVFTNNIMSNGKFHGPGNTIGDVFRMNFPGGNFRRNIQVGVDEWSAGQYPADNFYVPGLEVIRFVDLAGGDYRLAATSPYKGAGTDGTDPGCDFDALNGALAGQSSRSPAPAPISYPAPNQPPVANAGGPYRGTVSQPISMTGSSSYDPDGTIVSYQWDFGDGTTASGPAPIHSYASPATYTLRLTVTDNNGATHSAHTPVTVQSGEATTDKASLSLSGSGPYMTVPSSTGLDITGQITVEAWIKTNWNDTQQGIVERYGQYPAADGGFALRLNHAGKLAFYTCRNNHEWDGVIGRTTLSTGVWHHVAGVFDGKQLRVYVNGVLDGSKSSTFAPGTGAMDVKIGARSDDGAFVFNGLIDEARVTAASLYHANFTPLAQLDQVSGTRGLWKLDNSARDSSGHGHDGSLMTGARFSPEVPPPAGAGGGGALLATPILIEAEKFDEGGEGVAYHDADSVNRGGQFRASGVDIGGGGSPLLSGGYGVGWIKAGEWLRYTIDVAAAGRYTIEARVASEGIGGTFHIEIDGVDVTGPMRVPNTIYWSSLQTISRTGVQVSAGRRVVRVVMDSEGASGYVGDLDFIRLIATP